jgi:glycosyltransferase involved in cell wall biosynthesis
VPSELDRPVRVLHVIRPAVGGMKAHMLQLATGLVQYGFEAEVACPGDSDLVQDALERKLTVHPIPIVGPMHPFLDPLAVWELADVIRERKPALVHAHGFKAGLIARLAALFAGGVPAILTVHNHVLYRDLSPFTRWRYITAERWLSGITARIITVSDALRDELVEEYGISPRKITTVHNGLDMSPFLGLPPDRPAARARYRVPARAIVYGIAARFAPQKAMDVLVAAAVPVLERHEDAWLVLAGDGPLLESVRAQARRTAVGERIVFPGFETNVPGFLEALDVYASAALSEGLPLATIEAMAAGLPVVSTRAGGTPEVVEDGVTGVLVEPGSVDALSLALERMAIDAKRRREMGDAGRARALDEFSEERMFERTAAVYRKVI